MARRTIPTTPTTPARLAASGTAGDEAAHDVADRAGRPPLVDSDRWLSVTKAAGWRCECVGECGHAHSKRSRDERCHVEYRPARPLLVAPEDLATPFSRSQSAPLAAWCEACYDNGTRRSRRAAAGPVNGQLDLFATNPGDPGDLGGDAS